MFVVLTLVALVTGVAGAVAHLPELSWFAGGVIVATVLLFWDAPAMPLAQDLPKDAKFYDGPPLAAGQLHVRPADQQKP